jgi:endonuclease I
MFRIVNGFSVIMSNSVTRKLLFTNNIKVCIYTKKLLTSENLTVEHIIPKCKMPEHFKDHKYNLYPCDSEINRLRSNYKYEETPIDMIFLVEKEGIIINKQKKCVYINNEAKGIVGRRIIYFTFLFKKTFDHVLDYETALKWSRENPPSETELKWKKIVRNYIKKGNYRDQ